MVQNYRASLDQGEQNQRKVLDSLPSGHRMKLSGFGRLDCFTNGSSSQKARAVFAFGPDYRDMDWVIIFSGFSPRSSSSCIGAAGR